MLIIHRKINLVLLTFFSILYSCATTYRPLTKSIIKEYALSEKDLSSIQYYISDETILRREVVAIDKVITGEHTLKKVKDKYIEEVVFKEKTPGILKAINSDALNIAFEHHGFLSFWESGNYFVLNFGKTNEIQTIEFCSGSREI